MTNNLDKEGIKKFKDSILYILEIIEPDMEIKEIVQVLGLIFYKYISDNSLYEINKNYSWGKIMELTPPLLSQKEINVQNLEVEEINKEDFPTIEIIKDYYNKLDQLMVFLEFSFDNLIEQNYAMCDIFENIFEDFWHFSFDDTDKKEIMRDVILHLDNINFKDIPIKVIGESFNNLINNNKIISNDSDYLPRDLTYPSRSCGKFRKIIVKLINPGSNEAIYDPVCGVGGFLVEAFRTLNENNNDNKKLRIYGQEIEPAIYSICRMNLIMNGIYEGEITLGDTILEPAHIIDDNKIKTFDKIIAHIPNNYQLPDNCPLNKTLDDRWNRFSYGRPFQNKSDLFFIQHIISSLNDKGLAVVISSHNIFMTLENEKIMEKMIESDLIDTIIYLRERDKTQTIKRDMKIMLIINKNKNEMRKNRILFISNEEIRKINKIVEIYKEYKEIQGTSRIAHISEIRNKNYKLHYKIYDKDFKELGEKLSSNKARRLYEIADFIYGVSGEDIEGDDNGIPLIEVKNLNKELLPLETEKTKKVIFQDPKYIIRKKAILLSRTGKLRPTVFNPKGNQNIILNKYLIGLIPDENAVIFDYLYYKLYDEKIISEQIENFKYEDIILKNDLVDIIIPLPDFDEQEKYIKNIKERLSYEEEVKFKKRMNFIYKNYETKLEEKEWKNAGRLVEKYLGVDVYSKLEKYEDVVTSLKMGGWVYINMIDKVEKQFANKEKKDLTFIAVSYYKAIEIYLLEKVYELGKNTDKVITRYKNDSSPLKITEYNKKDIEEDYTIGNYNYFIKNNPNIMLQNKNENWNVYNEIKNWIDTYRNSTLHKHFIQEVKNLENIRTGSDVIYFTDPAKEVKNLENIRTKSKELLIYLVKNLK